MAHAGTVGHWKFEPGAFLADSSGNATLTEYGDPQQVIYPSEGRGSSFPAGHNAGAEFGDPGQFFGAETTAITGDITVEAFVQRDSNAASYGQLIAGQFNALDISYGSWSFEARVNGSWGTQAGELIFGGGIGQPIPIRSGLVVELNKDYYVAAAVNIGSGSATFYAQNLTDGGELLRNTVSHTITGLNSYTSTWIGETPDNNNFTFDGLIDEVRISDTVLGENELLVSAVPLPAGVWLLGSALVALLGFQRRGASRKGLT
jgi:hypothetical protein